MSLEILQNDNETKFVFKADPSLARLRLIVILSPIFIASFDTDIESLGYLKATMDKSTFPYALYPNFFENFSIEAYRKAYANYDPSEDIYLNEDMEIEFRVNKLDDIFAKALGALIEGLIIDDIALAHYLEYFAEIRNDIVKNGRRSILANGIQAFYLSGYVVVWMIDLCKYIKNNRPDLYEDIGPIYELACKLKTPGDIKGEVSDNI